MRSRRGSRKVYDFFTTNLRFAKEREREREREGRGEEPGEPSRDVFGEGKLPRNGKTVLFYA